MNTRREWRLKSLLVSEIATFLQRLDGGIFTVTEVEFSPDLREARVFYSFFGEDKEGLALELRRRMPELHSYLRQRLAIKYIPKIHFVLDRGLAHQAKIEKRFHD